MKFLIVHHQLKEHHEHDDDDEHTPEQIELMQTQDIKYITMKKTIEANKIRRMQSELHMIDEANNVKNTHLFFTDDGQIDPNVDLAERLDTHPALVHRRTNRPHLKDLGKLSLLGADIEVSFREISIYCISPSLTYRTINSLLNANFRRYKSCIRNVMSLTMN